MVSPCPHALSPAVQGPQKPLHATLLTVHTLTALYDLRRRFRSREPSLLGRLAWWLAAESARVQSTALPSGGSFAMARRCLLAGVPTLPPQAKKLWPVLLHELLCLKRLIWHSCCALHTGQLSTGRTVQRTRCLQYRRLFLQGQVRFFVCTPPCMLVRSGQLACAACILGF